VLTHTIQQTKLTYGTANTFVPTVLDLDPRAQCWIPHLGADILPLPQIFSQNQGLVWVIPKFSFCSKSDASFLSCWAYCNLHHSHSCDHASWPHIL